MFYHELIDVIKREKMLNFFIEKTIIDLIHTLLD